MTMPELPEMENYRALLAERIVGHEISDVIIGREKSINMKPDEFARITRHHKIVNVERRAKYLIFHLENGYQLLLHLMLGGWMFYGKESEKPKRTVQVQLSFGENNLYFIGLRLGYLHVHTRETLHKELMSLGPEPLDKTFTVDIFMQIIAKHKGALKTTLLKQDVIAGIGNRYSDEILWQAKLLPHKKASTLVEPEIKQLFSSIQDILRQAIASGGYMENRLFIGDSHTGGYAKMMYVHDREGEPCKRCGHPITKTEMSSHATFYCGECQV